MKKNYSAPLSEDIKMDALMQSALDIATMSNVQQQTADAPSRGVNITE